MHYIDALVDLQEPNGGDDWRPVFKQDDVIIQMLRKEAPDDPILGMQLLLNLVADVAAALNETRRHADIAQIKKTQEASRRAFKQGDRP